VAGRPKRKRRRRPQPERHAARPKRKPATHARPRSKTPRRRASTRVAAAPPAPGGAALSPISAAELAQLGAALAAEPDVVRGLELLLTLARRATGAEAGTVYLRREETLEFAVVQNDVLARQVGEEEVRRRVGGRALSLRDPSIASYVVLTRATVNLRDAYEIPVDRPYTLLRAVDRKADYQTRSMLALPLRDARQRVVGVLQLINALDPQGAVRPFSAEEQQLVQQMAAQAARLPGLPGG
jgi:GAF domain-containing protein